MIFSDLGTLSVEATRGFSAYRWIRQQLIARGVPEEAVKLAERRLIAVNAAWEEIAARQAA